MPSTLLLIAALSLTSASPPTEHRSPGLTRSCSALDYNEFAIDTGVALTHSDQNRPSVAFDGQNYLAVWHDEPGLSGGDIWGARLSSDGLLLDPHGFAVCTEPHVQQFPAVASACSVYLTVWRDLRLESSGDIFGARVTAHGNVIDGDGTLICGALGTQELPAIAAGDSLWLAVWQDRRLTTCAVYGARICMSGEVLDPGGIQIAAGPGNRQSPAVAFNGTEFLVVWQSDEYGPWTLRGTRVTQEGEVLDVGGFPIAGDMSEKMVTLEASVASDGQQFLAAWQNDSGVRGVYARTVSSDGQTLGPVNRLSSGLLGYRPTAAWDGTQYQVLWDDGRIVGARLNRFGIPRGPCYYVSAEPGAQHFGAVAGGDEQCVAAWESDPYSGDYNSQVHVVRLDTSGTVLDTPTIKPWGTPVYSGQHAPAIAAHDSGYVVVWESQCPYGYSAWTTDICAATLTRDGVMTDAHAITLASLAWDELTPAVACGDSNSLVTWTWGAHRTGIYGTRLSPAGAILDSDGLTISANGEAPAVVFDGTNYLVAWAESKNIYGARVSQAGGVMDRIPISTMSVAESLPAIAFDGENYLVSWTAGDVVWGTLVTPEGTLIDPSGFCVSGAGHRAWSPAVAAGEAGFFTAWVDYRTTWCEIFGARIDSAGRVLDTAGIAVSRWGNWPYNEFDPCVSACGTNFVAFWEDDYYTAELHGAVINTSGERTDTFVLSQMPMNEPLVASAEGSDGRVLCVFSAVRDPNGNGRDTVPRIWGSFVSSSDDLAEPHGLAAGRPTLAAGPNPFSRTTWLRFGHELLGADARVAICDAAGRCVRRLNVCGRASVNWDGTDNLGLPLPRGIYFCTLRTGAVAARLKLIKLD
jgi:hypothetical protein